MTEEQVRTKIRDEIIGVYKISHNADYDSLIVSTALGLAVDKIMRLQQQVSVEPEVILRATDKDYTQTLWVDQIQVDLADKDFEYGFIVNAIVTTDRKDNKNKIKIAMKHGTVLSLLKSFLESL